MKSCTKTKLLKLFIPLVCVAALCLVSALILPSFSSKGNDAEKANARIAGDNVFVTANTKKRIDKSDWKLTLINADHSLPENYSITLTQLKNGQAVDERCYPDLQKMMDDCRKAGNNPLICSSYRTQEKQRCLFERQIQKWTAKGYSESDAKAKAATVVAVPGTSEHQLGLALDIVDADNQSLDTSQENTPTQKWLMENSWKYGFILRYPNDKKEITKIIYEPWHYRYVGKTAAKEIYDAGVCLEEYLQQ